MTLYTKYEFCRLLSITFIPRCRDSVSKSLLPVLTILNAILVLLQFQVSNPRSGDVLIQETKKPSPTLHLRRSEWANESSVSSFCHSFNFALLTYDEHLRVWYQWWLRTFFFSQQIWFHKHRQELIHSSDKIWLLCNLAIRHFFYTSNAVLKSKD